MKPWKLLASAPPAATGALSLWQRDDEFVIRVDGAELMSSRRRGSEMEMAQVAGTAISKPGAQVLVGGLGFGFTLRAVLDRLGRGGHVTVAEISSAVIDWNQRFVGDLAGRPLSSAKATVKHADVQVILSEADGHYDAVLLDVDNGPWGLTVASNQTLCQSEGIGRVARALKPGGTLVVWSAGRDPAFSARLRAAGFSVTEHSVRAQNGRGARHTLFVASLLAPERHRKGSRT